MSDRTFYPLLAAALVLLLLVASAVWPDAPPLLRRTVVRVDGRTLVCTGEQEPLTCVRGEDKP